MVNYCCRCGREGFAEIGAKLFRCPHCGFELYMNASAAVAAMISDGTRLLVTVRKHDPVKGTWDLPGGFVDPGETAEEALRREIREELSMELGDLHYFGSFPNEYRYGGVVYATLDLIFTCEMSDLSGARAGDDVADVLIVPRKELDPARFGLSSIQEVVKAYVATPPLPSQSPGRSI